MDEKDRKTAKQEKLQKKPNPFVYYFVGFFFSLMIRLQFNLHTKGKKPKGPAIILSNHTSNHDYKFIASALWPRRVTFVATYHWFTFKTLGFWLRTMGAIPKYQFAPDMASMKKIRYVLDKNKGMVFIAPEGTVYGEGRLGFISPSIAKTIKIFGVPVYASHIEGAGLGNAKWSRRTHRGRVEVETSEIITKEESVNNVYNNYGQNYAIVSIALDLNRMCKYLFGADSDSNGHYHYMVSVGNIMNPMYNTSGAIVSGEWTLFIHRIDDGTMNKVANDMGYGIINNLGFN